MLTVKKSLVTLFSLSALISTTSCKDDEHKLSASDFVDTSWYKTREVGTETIDSKTTKWDESWNAGPKSKTEYLDFTSINKGTRSYRANSESTLVKTSFSYNVTGSTLYIDYSSSNKQQYSIYQNGDRMVLTLTEKTTGYYKEVQSEYYRAN